MTLRKWCEEFVNGSFSSIDLPSCVKGDDMEIVIKKITDLGYVVEEVGSDDWYLSSDESEEEE